MISTLERFKLLERSNYGLSADYDNLFGKKAKERRQEKREAKHERKMAKKDRKETRKQARADKKVLANERRSLKNDMRQAKVEEKQTVTAALNQQMNTPVPAPEKDNSNMILIIGGAVFLVGVGFIVIKKMSASKKPAAVTVTTH